MFDKVVMYLAGRCPICRYTDTSIPGGKQRLSCYISLVLSVRKQPQEAALRLRQQYTFVPTNQFVNFVKSGCSTGPPIAMDRNAASLAETASHATPLCSSSFITLPDKVLFCCKTQPCTCFEWTLDCEGTQLLHLLLPAVVLVCSRWALAQTSDPR